MTDQKPQVSRVWPKEEAARRRMPVTDGDEHDVCPLCGIWRVNAGYTPDSCGAENFQRPGCFVEGK